MALELGELVTEPLRGLEFLWIVCARCHLALPLSHNALSYPELKVPVRQPTGKGAIMAVTEPTTAMEMLALAIADPRRAEAWAERMLSEDADAWTLSVARHARGIVLRDRGLLEPALVELRLAVRLARRSGDVDRESDVRATLGSVLALAGRTAAGLEQFRRAIAAVGDPVVAAKILVRRSSCPVHSCSDNRAMPSTT